ncbi:hypothetical protein C8R43DRAFT_964526 [Mycena crocata]|nr:hypothetical protein C8R43DRAFT_964526 [Mycena crocata]
MSMPAKATKKNQTIPPSDPKQLSSRCELCPGNPDKSKCKHTVVGARYLATRCELLSKAGISPSTTSASGDSSPPSSPIPQRGTQPQHTRSSTAYLPAGMNPYWPMTQSYGFPGYAQHPGWPPYVNPMLPYPGSQSIPGLSAAASAGPQHTPPTGPSTNSSRQEIGTAAPAGHALSSESTFAISPTPSAPVVEAQRAQIDPALSDQPVSPRQSFSPSPSPQQSLTPRPSSPQTPSPSPVKKRASVSVSKRSAAAAASKKRATQQQVEGLLKPRVRVTASQPRFGMVAGAMRGNQPLSIYRRKPYPEPWPDPPHRFNKIFQDIVARAEHLAAETGCYLLIAGAHRSASAATHWVSPALRAEALGDATQMLNQFATTYGAIKRSRGAEAIAITKDLIKAEADKSKLELVVQEARLALASAQDQMALQAGIIAKYTAQ